jgi:hypothetical protein
MFHGLGSGSFIFLAALYSASHSMICFWELMDSILSSQQVYGHAILSLFLPFKNNPLLYVFYPGHEIVMNGYWNDSSLQARSRVWIGY